jgi:hypothetical protein
MLGGETFSDAIVVQGVAGAGKSAFTLRLANRLLDEGLRPIRIRIRDLCRFEHDVYQTLGEAIRVDDPEVTDGIIPFRDPLLDGKIFDKTVTFGEARISPYVLILDGWDELTVAGSRSFQDRLKDLLLRLREGLLRRPHRAPIRLVLTGRPSPALEGSSFLLDNTPILTLRSIRPEQLHSYARSLVDALKSQRLRVKEWAPWRLEIDNCEPAFQAYERWFEKQSAAAEGRDGASIDVLGLPLLALLAFRLLAEWNGAPGELWEQPTTLYRHLLDVTVQHAGKGSNDGLESRQVAHAMGSNLRQLLRRTAAAITAHGVEAIPFKELEARLEEHDLQAVVKQETEHNPLHALVIAFYFKGGHPDLGCEFLHKSFREYLCAEDIVESLKDFARSGRPIFSPRTEWWRDFGEAQHGTLFDLSRRITRSLGPRWLTPEVRRDLRALLEWELARAVRQSPTGGSGCPTEPMTLGEWEYIRDAVAALWEWWAEGVHLRLQPSRKKKGKPIKFDQPYVTELIETWIVPQADTGEMPQVPRVTTVDARIGDGLFEIATSLHYHIARHRGWDGKWINRAPSEMSYQTVLATEPPIVLFRPGGDHGEYFWNLCARINAAGFRPRRPFPGATDVRGVDLSHARLWGLTFFEADLRQACLIHASMQQTILVSARLDGANLRGARIGGADFSDAVVRDALLPSSDDWPLSLLRRAADTGEPVESCHSERMSNNHQPGVVVVGGRGAVREGGDLPG